MRKSKMWKMVTVAAVAASMTCGMVGVQSVSADDKKTLKFIFSFIYKLKKGTKKEQSAPLRFAPF